MLIHIRESLSRLVIRLSHRCHNNCYTLVTETSPNLGRGRQKFRRWWLGTGAVCLLRILKFRPNKRYTNLCRRTDLWYHLNMNMRFLERVEFSDGCWIWTGARDTKGYGRFTVCRKSYRASRFFWTLFNGPITDGLLACHHCDNPPCVNPNHLFLGTAFDNAQDMISKNRQATFSLSRQTLLPRDQIDSIQRQHQLGRSPSELAREFNVSVGYISSVCSKYWGRKRIFPINPALRM